MKVAAIHLDSTFADIYANEKKAEQYIREAKDQGCSLIVLPEFFTTGFSCSRMLIKKVIETESPKEKLKQWAEEYDCFIGGSYLAFDGEDIRNTFTLAGQDGETYDHSKDIPTMLENYVCIKGDTDSVFDTSIGRIGVAVGWEQLRYATVCRMLGKVDVCLAASCWWGFSKADPHYLQRLTGNHQKVAVEAPITLAKLLGVPVIHASHHASYNGRILISPMEKETRTVYGATQIIDGEGVVLGRRNYTEAGGIVTAEIRLGEGRRTIAIPKEAGYWIPEMAEDVLAIWNTVNKNCHSFYEIETKKAWKASCNFAHSRL